MSRARSSIDMEGNHREGVMEEQPPASARVHAAGTGDRRWARVWFRVLPRRGPEVLVRQAEEVVPDLGAAPAQRRPRLGTTRSRHLVGDPDDSSAGRVPRRSCFGGRVGPARPRDAGPYCGRREGRSRRSPVRRQQIDQMCGSTSRQAVEAVATIPRPTVTDCRRTSWPGFVSAVDGPSPRFWEKARSVGSGAPVSRPSS